MRIRGNRWPGFPTHRDRSAWPVADQLEPGSGHQPLQAFERPKFAVQRARADPSHRLGEKRDFQAGLFGGEPEGVHRIARRHVKGAYALGRADQPRAREQREDDERHAGTRDAEGREQGDSVKPVWTRQSDRTIK